MNSPYLIIPSSHFSSQIFFRTVNTVPRVSLVLANKGKSRDKSVIVMSISALVSPPEEVKKPWKLTQICGFLLKVWKKILEILFKNNNFLNLAFLKIIANLWADVARTGSQTSSYMSAALGWGPLTPLVSRPLATLRLSSLCLSTMTLISSYIIFRENSTWLL